MSIVDDIEITAARARIARSEREIHMLNTEIRHLMEDKRRLRWAIYEAGSAHAGGKPIDEIMNSLREALGQDHSLPGEK